MRKISLIIFLAVFSFASFAFAEGMSEHQHGSAADAQTTDMSMEMTKVHVCPMDQYTSDKAGRCPLCGMNLEEKEMSASEAKDAVEKSKRGQGNEKGVRGSHSH